MADQHDATARSFPRRISAQWGRGIRRCGWWFIPLQTFLLGLEIGWLT